MSWHRTQAQLYGALGLLTRPDTTGGEGDIVSDGDVPASSPATTPASTPGLPTISTPAYHDQLHQGEGLTLGAALHSQDGRFTLTLGQDGNLFLSGPKNEILWMTGTWNKNVVEGVMQPDGRFALYDSHGAPVWTPSMPPQISPGFLLVRNDGNVVITNHLGLAVWSTATTYAEPPLPAADPPPPPPSIPVNNILKLVGGGATASTPTPTPSPPPPPPIVPDPIPTIPPPLPIPSPFSPPPVQTFREIPASSTFPLPVIVGGGAAAVLLLIIALRRR